MADWIADLLKYGGGAATGWLAHTWRTSAERAGRRRAFRGFIRRQLERFESLDWKMVTGGEVFQMHQDSVTAIADRAAEILDDVPKRRRRQFNAARIAYRSLKREDVEPYDPFDPVKRPTAINFPNYERGIQTVAGLLKEMLEYAK